MPFLLYSDDPPGARTLYDPIGDLMYIMDDYGYLTEIPWSLGLWYWQSHD